MCKDMSEEQLLLLEKVEDPNELRRLLDEISGCRDCSCMFISEPKIDDSPCRIYHQVRARNRVLYIFDKIGF